MDLGETPLQTIKREVKEELGLDIENDMLTELGFIERKHSLAFMYYLKKDIDLNALTLQKSEVESVQYMSVEQIRTLMQQRKISKSHGIIFEKVLEHFDR